MFRTERILMMAENGKGKQWKKRKNEKFKNKRIINNIVMKEWKREKKTWTKQNNSKNS